MIDTSGVRQVVCVRASRVWLASILLGIIAFSAVLSGTASAAPCPNAALRAGSSGPLPDCRAYEQVSPTDKGGFAAYPTQVAPAQILSNGEGIAYLNYQAFPGAEGNTAVFASHVSRRSEGSGWQTTEMTPPVPPGAVQHLHEASYAFSEDLRQVVMRVPLVALTPQATPGVYNLFLRHPNSEFSWINAATPLLSAEEFCVPNEFELASCFELADVSTFAGASQDYGQIIFESNAQLTPEAPEMNFFDPTSSSLYESTGGKVRLAGILPDGEPAATSTAGAGSSIRYAGAGQVTDGRVEHAMSQDGSRVVFQAPADGGAPVPAQGGMTEVYDRINGEETIELSRPAPGAEGNAAEPATFWAASQDGSRVFFTSAAALTSQSKTSAENSAEDLYEYNVDTRTLTDLTVDTNPIDESGAMVQGVVDISHDGSYVYFVAKGQIDAGARAKDGKPNLYVVHNGGVPTFIATLGEGTCEFEEYKSADSCDWAVHSPELEANVTPDGLHVAFMSTMSIPTTNFPEGYDNRDQSNPEMSDSEVYEYSVVTGNLICASCDPSGQRPEGSALIGGINPFEEVRPGQQPYQGVSTPFHRVRALNDSGTRLFYVAPAPHGGPAERVYEYEEHGEGGCTSEPGCQYMISGPETGGETDQFLGTSETGNDAFLATVARLSPTDKDNLMDIYDARVGGGFQVPSTELPCENTCHQPAATAGTPKLLSGFSGPSGNFPPPKATKKPPTRAQKLAKALRTCRATKHRKRKRASCEAAARHRFGSKAKRSTAKRRAKR